MSIITRIAAALLDLDAGITLVSARTQTKLGQRRQDKAAEKHHHLCANQAALMTVAQEKHREDIDAAWDQYQIAVQAADRALVEAETSVKLNQAKAAAKVQEAQAVLDKADTKVERAASIQALRAQL